MAKYQIFLLSKNTKKQFIILCVYYCFEKSTEKHMFLTDTHTHTQCKVSLYHNNNNTNNTLIIDLISQPYINYYYYYDINMIYLYIIIEYARM